MPQFQIGTLELHTYEVQYFVEAATREEAVRMVVRGEVSYDCKESSDHPLLKPSEEVKAIMSIDEDDISDNESAALIAAAKAA